MRPITFQKTRHPYIAHRRSFAGVESLLSLFGALAILLLVTAAVCAAIGRKLLG